MRKPARRWYRSTGSWTYCPEPLNWRGNLRCCGSPEGLRGDSANRFTLLVAGHKVGALHHQTLQRRWEWSYQLLSPQEQLLLATSCRLSAVLVNCGCAAVCTGEGITPQENVLPLANLQDKFARSVSVGDRTLRISLETRGVICPGRLARSSTSPEA